MTQCGDVVVKLAASISQDEISNGLKGPSLRASSTQQGERLVANDLHNSVVCPAITSLICSKLDTENYFLKPGVKGRLSFEPKIR